MINSLSHYERVPKIRAIFFDLHHTLTKTRIDFPNLLREATSAVGIDISQKTDEQFKDAITKVDFWIKQYQIDNDVDIHWGTEPEQWMDVNRKMLEYLRFNDIQDQTLINLERAWKEIMKSNWESLVDDAKEILEELHQRGYTLGVCTRRHDDPEILLERWGIRNLFSSLHWTAVPGYAKPSPYTLIHAAYETHINPRLCAYIGNTVDADVAAAVNAEMLPILTTWANPQERELAPEQTIVIDTLSRLLELFTSSPN
jgi:phosphoglycolate phosphatase-like HAD superfamily hydrolase